MEFNVEVSNLSLKYKKFEALKDVSFQLEDRKIYGLIGRNGAGKTSLLSLLASLRQVTEGTIKVGGEYPMENPAIMQHIAYIHETDYKEESGKVKNLIKLAGRYRPYYDVDYAKYLVGLFNLDENRSLNKLSKGMQSVFDVIVGLSSRAPITIFDEAYLGMDAPTRMLFYQELLEDQEKHPRIIILSTHLVSEMDYLFDEVLILHKGMLLVKEEYETLISKGVTITGAANEVDAFVEGRKKIGEKKLGNTKAIILYEEQTDDLIHEAHKRGLDIGNIPLQDLFVYLTQEVS